MYWTLRASADFYAKKVQQARQDKRPIPQKPDIVGVWEYIDQLTDSSGATRPRARFYGLRAGHYLGKSTESTLKEAEQIYDVVNTHACQLGAVMALAALAEANGLTKGTAVASLAKTLIEAWNTALGSKSSEGRDRRLVFMRADLGEGEGQTTSKKYLINRIRRMDTPMSVYFRYFWLELLALPAAREKWKTVIDEKKFEVFRLSARSTYLAYLEVEQLKAVKQAHANKSAEWQEKEAHRIERSALKKALKYWFDVPEQDFDNWLKSADAAPSDQTATALMDDLATESTAIPDPVPTEKIEEDE
jgi:hypothetical protein